MACYPSLGKGRRGYVRGFWQNRNHGDCSSESLCPACVEISSVHGSMVPAGMKSTNSANPLLNARILGVSLRHAPWVDAHCGFVKTSEYPVQAYVQAVAMTIWMGFSLRSKSGVVLQCSVWHCCFLCFVFCVFQKFTFNFEEIPIN